jgi:pseudouridine synthase
MRLNRYIASANGMSRRAADEAISAGRVRVGEERGTLGQVVTDDDRVYLDDKLLSLPKEFTYIIYNKPVGLVVSRQHQGDDEIIYDHLPPEFERLRSVGRLDRDSSGLLVLTDDGDYAHKQTHPTFEKSKRYEVRLDKPLKDDDAQLLRAGVALEDGMSRLGLSDIKSKDVVVTISEGRNRQIRRSFEALGYTVIGLHRTDFGDLSLDGLKPGEWRHA